MTVTIPEDHTWLGRFLLDVPTPKAQSSQPDTRWIDPIVQLHGRPGQELHGRLEHAPDEGPGAAAPTSRAG